MKILIINGGWGKGNTWKVALMVKNYIERLSPNVIFEELHLKDINLPFCKGCSLCFRKGHAHCPHNKIVQNIMDKIEESDGVIFSAPTYNMQMPALTKNLVDHFCFMLHRPRYFNKKALVISTTGGVGAKKATKYMAGAMIGWGFNSCYQLYIKSISWNNYHIGEKHKKNILTITEKFYNDIESKKLNPPSVGALIPFNIFRGMGSEYAPGKEYETEDGAFWQRPEFASRAYFKGVPLPLYKKIFGNIFYTLAKKISKYNIVTYKK